MRSSLLLSGLYAATALGMAVEKREYTTEWTFVTVTTTITAPLPSTTSTKLSQVPAIKIWSLLEESSTSTVSAHALQSTTGEPEPVQVHTIELPPVTLPAQTVNEPAVTQAPDNNNNNNAQPAQATTWAHTWTSEWTIGQEPQPTTMSTSTSSATGTQPTNAYQSAVLYNHNVHRSNHSAPSLDWDNSLEESARKLAQGCVYKHDTSIDGGGYGQNIGYGVQEGSVGVMISNLMYNDEMGFFEALYGIASPLMEAFDKWGHFTQIVWKGSTHVGCATVTCPSLGNVDSGSSTPFTVCNYSPAGNMAGQYSDNVLRPLGHTIFSA